MYSKKFFKTQDYKNIQKRIIISLIILIFAILALAIYVLLFYKTSCKNSQCFSDSIANCKKVNWIRQDEKASWLYTILGSSKNEKCRVQVELLSINKGSIENEKLIGKSMICEIQKGETQFPEESMFRCSGHLREEMQEIIIQNLHNYLLENIGEIDEEFKAF